VPWAIDKARIIISGRCQLFPVLTANDVTWFGRGRSAFSGKPGGATGNSPFVIFPWTTKVFSTNCCRRSIHPAGSGLLRQRYQTDHGLLPLKRLGQPPPNERLSKLWRKLITRSKAASVGGSSRQRLSRICHPLPPSRSGCGGRCRACDVVSNSVPRISW
jgi:hypothetical protein